MVFGKHAKGKHGSLRSMMLALATVERSHGVLECLYTDETANSSVVDMLGSAAQLWQQNKGNFTVEELVLVLD